MRLERDLSAASLRPIRKVRIGNLGFDPSSVLLVYCYYYDDDDDDDDDDNYYATIISIIVFQR